MWIILVLGLLGLIYASTRRNANPVDLLPGPPRLPWKRFLMGYFEDFMDNDPGCVQSAWLEKYGDVVAFQAPLGTTRILISDKTALDYILISNSYSFPKPENSRRHLGRILGSGLVFVEGDAHKKQRKAIVPAFSSSQVRNLVPDFFRHAYQLRDKWIQLISDNAIDPSSFHDVTDFQNFQAKQAEKKTKDEAILDVNLWTARLTLDIIFSTGFGSPLASVDGHSTKFSDTLLKFLPAGTARVKDTAFYLTALLFGVSWFFPSLMSLNLPLPMFQKVKKSMAETEEQASMIIKESKLEIDSTKEGASRRDLIALLLKSNLKDESLTEQELIGQITTFIFAGHETTGTALTWFLWAIAQKQDIQSKLREEIQNASFGSSEPDAEDLNSLSYLDACTRETLRLFAPVPDTIRVAEKTHSVPLSTPVKLRNGKTVSEIVIPKGTGISISIAAQNTQKRVFGEDALEFRPERWLDGSVGKDHAGYGMYSQILTFLSGPRGCIGYRFAILEFKVISFVLLSNFKFAERDGPGLPLIKKESKIVTKPFIIGELKDGAKMPLRVSLA